MLLSGLRLKVVLHPHILTQNALGNTKTFLSLVSVYSPWLVYIEHENNPGMIIGPLCPSISITAYLSL